VKFTNSNASKQRIGLDNLNATNIQTAVFPVGFEVEVGS